MNFTIGEEVDQSGLELATIDVASWYREFEKVKDGRGEKGQRYPLPLLLTLLMLGKMAGESTIQCYKPYLQPPPNMVSSTMSGDVAQLGERDNRTVEVRGSSPLISTSIRP